MTDSSPTSDDDVAQPLSTPVAPSGPFSPPHPPPSEAFDPSHTPAVKGRNRASSISFDLGPFKALLRSLQADHDQLERRRSEGADDDGGEEGGREGVNPWEKGFDKEEVRSSLAELLLHVEGLTVRLHGALSRQLETEHELKIARSNLMLTEANVEMLEESLRRGGQFGQALMQQSQRKAGGTPFQSTSSKGPPPPINIPSLDVPPGLSSPVQLDRPPIDRAASHDSARRTQTAPSPVAVPSSPGASGSSSGGWLSKWGFSPGQADAGKLSAGGGELHRATLGSRDGAGSTPNLASSGLEAAAVIRSSPTNKAHAASLSTSATTPTHVAALAQLKTSLAEAQTVSTSLARELAAVKDAKQSLEAELEELTGQLFGEANAMVSEERQRAAAKDEEAKEARREREAMRQTVQLVEEDCRSLRRRIEQLGGGSSTDEGTTVLISPTGSTYPLPPTLASPSPSKRIPLKKGSNRSLRSTRDSEGLPPSPWAEEADRGADKLNELMHNMTSEFGDATTPTSASFAPPLSAGLHSPEPLRVRSPTPSFRSHISPPGSPSSNRSLPRSPSTTTGLPKSPSASSFKSFSSDGSTGSGGGYRALPTEAGGKGRKVLLLPQTGQ